jgi:hypothetical protein
MPSRQRPPLLATLAALAATTAASATPPDATRTPLNELHGVVVSATDGTPVPDAEVALSHADVGHLRFFGQHGLSVWGPSESSWVFFTRANTRTAAATTTDDHGRFTFRSFKDPTADYNIGVFAGDRGSELLLRITPADYADDGLRVELQPPARVRADWYGLTWQLGSSISRNTRLEFLPPDPADERPLPVYVFPYLWDAPDDQVRFALGPLPPGHRYRLTQQHLAPDVPGWITTAGCVFQTVAGQTIDVTLDADGGTSVIGTITGTDGKPLENVNVTVRTTDARERVFGALTDARGRYVLTGVPAGEHVLTLSRSRYRLDGG